MFSRIFSHIITQLEEIQLLPFIFVRCKMIFLGLRVWQACDLKWDCHAPFQLLWDFGEPYVCSKSSPFRFGGFTSPGYTVWSCSKVQPTFGLQQKVGLLLCNRGIYDRWCTLMRFNASRGGVSNNHIACRIVVFAAEVLRKLFKRPIFNHGPFQRKFGDQKGGVPAQQRAPAVDFQEQNIHDRLDALRYQ